MKKEFQCILIFCLMLGFIISCPALAKIACAGENANAIRLTTSVKANRSSRYVARLDQDITFPPTLDEIIDYIMNIPFIQNSIAWLDERKVRREERRESWRNRFNTD